MTFTRTAVSGRQGSAARSLLAALAVLACPGVNAQAQRVGGAEPPAGYVQQGVVQVNAAALGQAKGAGQQASGAGASAGAVQPGQPVHSQPQPYRDGDMPSPKVDLVNESIDRIAPLTAEELIRLRTELARRDAAMHENVSGRAPPRPTASVYMLDLSPRADVAPPVVRVSIGQGAVVSFLDATGNPWPIRVADNYNKVGFHMSQFTDHQLSFSLLQRNAMGNVMVALEGLPSAVGFTVVAGQPSTDYQVNMVVPKFKNGVPANVIAQESIPAVGTSDLYDYLLRTPPKTARVLQVAGMPGTFAWQTSPSKMVVRTQAQLTSATRYFSLDGVTVYEVPLSPLLMGTFNGRYVQLQISGFINGGLN
jgi:hypothetical protein